jgi:4-diphosphocytidyl-2-C-methyl-D-erythritol kinase
VESKASISVRCPAKLNLFLEVLGKRPDGYHEIETVIVALRDLHDTLSIRLADEGVLDLEVSAPPAWGIPEGEGNLVHRAARLVLGEGRAGFGLRISLRKRIPPGAGLGGGSSDAAGLLKTVNLLLDARLPRDRLGEIALSLGSDVPFFLQRTQVAVARGRGERLEQVTGTRPFRYLLAYPGTPASTEAVYARCRPAPEGGRRDAGPVLAALRKGSAEDLSRACFNRLAAPAREVCPGISEAVLGLESLGLGPARMTGSGSACFVVLGNEEGRRPDLARLAKGWPAGAWTGEA